MSTQSPQVGYAKKKYPIYWLLDVSGSLKGPGIQSLNYTMATVKTALLEIARDNPAADFYLRTMKIADQAEWIDGKLVKLENYEYRDLDAGGFSALGSAFTLLKKHFDELQNAQVRIFTPAVILVSDGRSTDNAKKALGELLKNKYGASATKLAISIGRAADKKLLKKFIGDPNIKVLEVMDNIRQNIIEHITFATSQSLASQMR